VLGTCAHYLAEQAYGHNDDDDPSALESIEKYRVDAANMFSVALRADPANVTNILWYAKFLHKTRKFAQVNGCVSICCNSCDLTVASCVGGNYVQSGLAEFERK
jgi:hypothetical protein